MSKSELFTYLESISAGGDTVGSVARNLAVVFVLMLFVYLIYRLVHLRSLTFDASFGFVIVLTGLVTGVIMMIIQNNLALSLGMVGALSIVRFRSAIKDPKDTGFIFWAVAEGLCAGTGNYVLGIISSLFIGASVLIYCFAVSRMPVHLMIIRGKHIDFDEIIKILDSQKIKYKVLTKSISDLREEFILKVNIKKNESISKMIANLSGVESVSMTLESES